VYQHLIEVGCAAVQVLHKMIEARREGKDDVDPAVTMLPPDLVIRDSSLLTLQAPLEIAAVR
jgi:DNA-binding LacI/PurR family transcriptional regulator